MPFNCLTTPCLPAIFKKQSKGDRFSTMPGSIIWYPQIFFPHHSWFMMPFPRRAFHFLVAVTLSPGVQRHGLLTESTRLFRNGPRITSDAVQALFVFLSFFTAFLSICRRVADTKRIHVTNPSRWLILFVCGRTVNGQPCNFVYIQAGGGSSRKKTGKGPWVEADAERSSSLLRAAALWRHEA